MDIAASFASDRPFYGDRRYFAYGLDRSGEFSVQQSELLLRHGWAYSSLTRGVREPVTAEEARFIEVFSKNLEPSSPHERAWRAYLTKVSKKSAVPSPGKISPGSELTVSSTD